MKIFGLIFAALLIATPVHSQIISGGGGGLATIPTVLTDHVFTDADNIGTSDSTLTPNLALYQAYAETNLGNAITINAPINATHFGQHLFFYFADNGTGRAITWNAVFLGSPSNTTVSSTKLYIAFELNPDGTHWDVLADSGASGASGVTTSGSPTTGAIAKFTGSSVITSGNLSGDCTTNGSLVVACGGITRNPTSYAYVISLSGGNTIATNQTTGAVDFTNADSRIVFQAVIDSFTTTSVCGSGGFYVRNGTYPFNSFGTETGGSLNYRVGVVFHNTDSGSPGICSYKMDGESEYGVTLNMTSTAMATLSSSELAIGVWVGHSSVAQDSTHTELSLSNFNVGFPNSTRGNQEGVDIRYAETVYAASVSVHQGDLLAGPPGAVPIEGTITDVGFRAPDANSFTTMLTDIQSQAFRHLFYLSDNTTCINCKGGYAYDQVTVGYSQPVPWAEPVTLIRFFSTDVLHGNQIGTNYYTNHTTSFNSYAEVIQYPAPNTGTFARVGEADEAVPGSITGDIDYTIVSHTDPPNPSYFNTGGTRFHVAHKRSDESYDEYGSSRNIKLNFATASKCLRTDASNFIVSAAADCGGSGGSVNFVAAARTTQQTYARNGGTATAVLFTGTDQTANSTMHNPGGSGACGASSKICLTDSSHCTVTANVLISPAAVSSPLLGITINLNGNLTTAYRIAQSFEQSATGLAGAGFSASGQVATGTGDYVEVYAYDGSTTGVATTGLGGTNADSITFTALCQ